MSAKNELKRLRDMEASALQTYVAIKAMRVEAEGRFNAVPTPRPQNDVVKKRLKFMLTSSQKKQAVR